MSAWTPRAFETFLRALSHVTETVQWGGSLVYWAADKSIGGKVFAVISIDSRGPVLSFSAGPERFAELVEREGLFPAPYLARAHWVAVESWTTLPSAELKDLLGRARDLVYEKLPKRTKAMLALPAAEQKS